MRGGREDRSEKIGRDEGRREDWKGNRSEEEIVFLLT